MNHWLAKLASTFILALVEAKLTPLHFLYFSTQISLNILAEQGKTFKTKCLYVIDEYWQARVEGQK